MVYKKTRDEIIRLHAMGMTIVVDKPSLGVDIIKYEDSFYRIAYCAVSVSDRGTTRGRWLISKVIPIKEEVTVWQEAS